MSRRIDLWSDDLDSIYSEGVDRTIAAMGLTVPKTPVGAPQANAFCERLIGTIRRECLDFVIPLSERHVRHVLEEWWLRRVYDACSGPSSAAVRSGQPCADLLVKSVRGRRRWRPKWI